MKRLLISLLAVGLSACWYPPFDEDAAQAASAIKKMELVFEVSFSGFSGNAVLFPIPASQVSGGFVLVDDPADATVKFLTRSFSSNQKKSGSPIPVFEGMDRYYSQIFGAFTSDPRMLQFFPGAPDPDSGWNQDVLVNAYSVSTGVFEIIGGFNFLADVAHPQYFAGLSPAPALGDLNLSGLHIYPDLDMNTVICHALVYLASENSIYELKFTVNASGTAVFSENINTARSGGLIENIPVPEGFFLPQKTGYFYSPVSQMSYINAPDNGSYRTVRWSVSEPPVETDVKEKILAVLTSGEILTIQDSYVRVYSPLGGLKYRIPLGDIQFAYETYREESPVMVFFHKHISDGKTVYSVYTNPTENLSGLQ